MHNQSLSIHKINMTRSQAPLSLEYILLGFLCQGPIHGYDLYKKISNFEGISLVWHIKQSQLYALLDKLAEDGLLTSNMVPGEVHLMRKEYQVTPVGRQSFLAWVISPVSHGRDMRQEFLAKLFFAQKSGFEISLELIEEQKAVCAEWLASLHISYSKTTNEQHYERMIFQYRISQTLAMLEWLDDCRAEIQSVVARNSGSEQ
jgi:DNA-binding PadR family transcriptional regulator